MKVRNLKHRKVVSYWIASSPRTIKRVKIIGYDGSYFYANVASKRLRIMQARNILSRP